MEYSVHSQTQVHWAGCQTQYYDTKILFLVQLRRVYVMIVAMDLYAENILDHYRHPRNKNLPSPSGRGVGARPAPERSDWCGGEGLVVHEEVNLSCGDSLTISLVITDDRITEIGWDGNGCAISQAAMSMLSEELMGKSLKEIELMEKKDIYELLGVPVGPRRFKCALLCLHTLKNAMRKMRGENAQGWSALA